MNCSQFKVMLLSVFMLAFVVSCKKKSGPPPIPNEAPTATGLTITGTAEVNKQLTGTYVYQDDENDAEAGSTFKWYRANDATGAGETVIADSIAKTYTLQAADQGKYIRFSVLPKAATGTTTGVEVKSSFFGAIGEATTVTFTYKGQQVTYGIINSAKTGRKWLDRNLGAPNSPTAFNDFANYGDLFQWGRGADGHQIVSRTSASAPIITDSTRTLATSSTPGHALFINNPNFPTDWLNVQNSNLWQGATGVNNPCPTGWRIPTLDEFTAEELTSGNDGYAKLKLTLTGLRGGANGSFFSGTSVGYYWTSTINAENVNAFAMNSSLTIVQSVNRAVAVTVRCIKN